MGKVFFGLGDDHFKRFDFVIFMMFIKTDAANDAVVDTLGFEAHQVENLANMVSAFAAVWVFELLSCLWYWFRHWD